MGLPSVEVCATPFVALARNQSKALGHADLPLAVVPYPMGGRSREELREFAKACAADIVGALTGKGGSGATSRQTVQPAARAERIEAPDDIEAFNRFFFERKWSEGLPVIPPTPERVERMLRHTRRSPQELVAAVPPAYGAATVERIAINAVMAGCHPEYLPVLIAAVEALADDKFHLQGLQATTNPCTTWLIVNGPMARQLEMNSGNNCLGPGNWANATLGRAQRLICWNIGGGYPGEVDKATHGHPAKFLMCCSEAEAESPWEPLHVERGFPAETSTVTVVAPLGTWNVNTQSRDVDSLVKAIAETMKYPGGSDYVIGGSPTIMMPPEHAEIFKRAGLSKADVKRLLWERSKLPVSVLEKNDLQRTQESRLAELGTFGPDTLLPISVTPEDITILVAGGPGTHSVYLPTAGYSYSVTRAIDAAEP